MDVVPDAGAVHGGVVVAEDAELLPDARRHLRDVGHQVVGYAVGPLADQTALVGADGVEVPQQHHGQRLVRRGRRAQDLLDEVFRPAVGIGAAAHRHVLRQRHGVVPAVHRGRGAEHDAAAAVLRHDLQQRQRGAQIVAVVHHRLGHGFAHRLVAREVDDGVDGLRVEHTAQRRLVRDVRLAHRDVSAGDLLHPARRFRAAVVEVIRDHHVIARLQTGHRRV